MTAKPTPHKSPAPARPVNEPWNTEKNGLNAATNPPPAYGWTEYLAFDKDGRIHIKDLDLAREVQSIMDTYNRLYVTYEDQAVKAPVSATAPGKSEQAMLRSKKTDTSAQSPLTAYGGVLKNPMCPCSPVK